MQELVTLSPLGLLGYGVPKDSLDRARREYDLDVIAVDGGSMDPGPNYLGRGEFFADEGMVERDLELLLTAATQEDVPFLLSTAGGSGSREHVEKLLTILEDVLVDLGLELDVGTIYSDVDPTLLRAKLDADEVHGVGGETVPTPDDPDSIDRAVAQVGVTPFVEAIEAGADVVVGGRASDLSPFAAVPLVEGFDPGLTYHMAKILECGARATTASSGNDCLVGVLRDDHFEVVPPNPDRRCTTESVAAHTLYEKSDPTTIELPEGTVDVTDASFEQVDERRVRCRGSVFRDRGNANVLVEGVTKAGYRTVTPAAVRDPQVIERFDELVARTHERVRTMSGADPDDFALTVRTYGDDGATLFDEETGGRPEELGVIIDAVGETQEIADTVCGFARSSLLHLTFPGRVNSGGNLAFPFSPSDLSVGPVYTLSLYHVLEDVPGGTVPDLNVETLGAVGVGGA